MRALALLVLFLLLGSGCGAPQSTHRDLNEWMGEGVNTDEYTKVDGSHTLTFPDDYGPHDDYLFEWWYLTSILDDQHGNEYGVQFTIFRRAVVATSESDNPWRSGQIYLAHVAVSDIRQKTHWEDERFSRGHPELAGSQVQPFRVYVEDWVLASKTSSFFPLELSASSKDYKIKLAIDEGKPMVLHGLNGYSEKIPNKATYYYSYVNMPARGTLERNGKVIEVSGKSWLDREWSSQVLGGDYEGWYWLSLNLDDGRHLVLFELHAGAEEAKALPTATWIDAEGATSSVAPEDWNIEPRRFWRSYPVEWVLDIDNTQYIVEAKIDDQVMDTRIRYWEGVVEVRLAKEVIGRGYMELTGYE